MTVPDTDRVAAAADLVHQQIAFYRADAQPYDDWLRSLLDDADESPQAVRFRDGRAVAERLLAGRSPLGRVLEIAAGTGILSELVARHCERLVLLDTSPASLALARRRVTEATPAAAVAYLCADVFSWPGRPGAFDTICFSSWLHHVPRGDLDRFWHSLERLLAPGGEVLFDFPDATTERRPIADAPASPSDEYALYGTGDVSVRDHGGRRWHVVDVKWDPDELRQRLAPLGWEMAIVAPGWFDRFHWAVARRSARRSARR